MEDSKVVLEDGLLQPLPPEVEAELKWHGDRFFVTPRESLTKILDQNALEYLASWEDLIGDRLRLEFLE